MYSSIVSLDSSDDEKEVSNSNPNITTNIPIVNTIGNSNANANGNGNCNTNAKLHVAVQQKILKTDRQLKKCVPIVRSQNTSKMKTKTNNRSIQNVMISQSSKSSINIPHFIKPPLFPRIPVISYRMNNQILPNFLKVIPTVNRMPINRKRPQAPMMPIIVSTRSLCNEQLVKPPFISAELTVTKVNQRKSPAKNSEIIPQVTIRKQSQIVNNKDFFNMAKPITTINLDDDDEVSWDKKPTSVEVVEIEFENLSGDSETELDPPMINDSVDDINSPLSTHSSSEKENSEPMVQLTKVIIEQPLNKRPKLSQSTDSIVEINQDKVESSFSAENSCIENIKVEDSIADNTDQTEFHSIYQNFLDLCLSLDDSEDMNKIVNKRLKYYYKSVDQSITKSKGFCTLIEKKMSEMKSTPEYLFIYIKEVVDELKTHRTKSKPDKSKETEDKVPLDCKVNSNDCEDANQNLIRRLERAMDILNKKITKLDEKEVDYDDEDNSAYILVDRYKARAVQTYKRLCKLKGQNDLNRKHKNAYRVLSRLSLNDCKIPNVMKSLKTMSLKVPNWFPNFYEVLKCVENCASAAGMRFTDIELRSIARNIFVEVGSALKSQRQYSEYQDLCLMLADSEPDPAENDPNLAAVLNHNRKICKIKENNIIDRFANIESSLKSVPTDVKEKDDNTSKTSEDDVIIIDETENTI